MGKGKNTKILKHTIIMDMRLRYYLNLMQNIKLKCWYHFAFPPVIFYSNYIFCLNFDANIVGLYISWDLKCFNKNGISF